MMVHLLVPHASLGISVCVVLEIAGGLPFGSNLFDEVGLELLHHLKEIVVGVLDRFAGRSLH